MLLAIAGEGRMSLAVSSISRVLPISGSPGLLVRTRRAFVLSIAIISISVPLGAQDVSAPDTNAPVRFGPLALAPTVKLVNLGVDTNVFFEPDTAHPKSDFTTTLQPGTGAWLHMGRSYFEVTVKEDLVYYQQYSNQRSANNFETLGFTAPLTRFTFKAGVRYANTFDRPGYEISERVHHIDTGYNGAAEVKVLSKTFVGIHADRGTFRYDEHETFMGVDLRQELNRTSTNAGVTIRDQLTPLTAITVDGSAQQDRFEFNPLRNADSKQISAGAQFDPFALISGSATVGYRDFTPLAAGVPAFQGVTANVHLTYTAAGATKIAVEALRDVQYSYDVKTPYYVEGGATVSASQQIYGPVDAVGRLGAYNLSYRVAVGAGVGPDDTDTIRLYGGGVGYRIGRAMRIGANVESQRRTSAVAARNYHGLLYGISATYDF